MDLTLSVQNQLRALADRDMLLVLLAEYIHGNADPRAMRRHLGNQHERLARAREFDDIDADTQDVVRDFMVQHGVKLLAQIDPDWRASPSQEKG